MIGKGMLFRPTISTNDRYPKYFKSFSSMLKYRTLAYPSEYFSLYGCVSYM